MKKRSVSIFFLFVVTIAFGLYSYDDLHLFSPSPKKKKSVSLQQLPILLQSAISSALGKEKSGYHFSSKAEGYDNQHPTQHYRIHLNQEEVKISRDRNEWGLKLTRFGAEQKLQELSRSDLRILSNRAEYRYSNSPEIVAWYENGPLGLQQGFTIQSPPSKLKPDSKVVLSLSQTGNLKSELKNNEISLKNEKGEKLFRYAGLIAYDSRGKNLPTQMRLDASRLLIEVDDKGANYPIVVDPFIQTQKLTASDGAANDSFGVAVAINGSTIVVGASGEEAAYIFTSSNNLWSQSQKLTATDTVSGDGFGSSVAITNSTIVIGAPTADIAANTDQGAAYIFSLSNGTWSQSQKLTANDGAALDHFGGSASINDATISIGAAEANVGLNADQGAVYIFTSSNGTWSQSQKLTASDGASGDLFGSSVSLSGPTIAIGSRGAEISGNTDQGAAYVFSLSNGIWSQSQKLTANDGATLDSFGDSIAIDEATLAVGARLADVGGNTNQGAVYLFYDPSLVSALQGLSGGGCALSTPDDRSTVEKTALPFLWILAFLYLFKKMKLKRCFENQK